MLVNESYRKGAEPGFVLCEPTARPGADSRSSSCSVLQRQPLHCQPIFATEGNLIESVSVAKANFMGLISVSSIKSCTELCCADFAAAPIVKQEPMKKTHTCLSSCTSSKAGGDTGS